jgi:NAD(P)-dependent dehydrogenase (short-subunit alcohol dehydrogenase family)
MRPSLNQSVTVYGAYGHTGRFIAAELRKRGWTPILSGRDANRLTATGAAHEGADLRPASVDDPASLDRALAGASAVINCAGPFASTATPVIEAALRARIPYLDVAAEIEANLDTFERHATAGRDAGIAIVQAMAFYGGLGDLLATAAMGDWSSADDISIAYGLDSWKPTLGTRAASRVSRQRRGGRRIVFSNHRLELRDDGPPIGEWTFPAPLGRQAVMGEFTMADTLTISRHIDTPEIRSYMTVAAVKDVSAADTPLPEAIDESGRSSQTFLVEVVARRGSALRRAVARGRDIYAVTAPLVVEATERILGGLVKTTGVLTAGQAFDARDFLRALCPEHLTLELNDGGRPPGVPVRHPPDHNQPASHDPARAEEIRDEPVA